jgi:iron complex outermembrane receptor protein
MKTITETSPKVRLATRLMLGSSIALIAALTAVSAQAQTASTGSGSGNTAVGEITVTGTSIRGTAPVGSSIVTVGQAQIEDTGAQTIQDVLKSVPAIVGSQSAGQGSFGSADASGTDAPTIHGLGASASNSTLTLIDGHRFPLTGINHQLGDPNVIPSIALQRVEVLSDGASSIYGSDAVAGVVNFITRSHFDGFAVQGQRGFGDHYSSSTFSAIGGKDWDSGSAYVAYNYSNKSSLQAKDRPYTAANHLAQGGTNLSSFACGQATIQPTGSSTIYPSPYTAGVSNASVNAMCDYTGLADLLPSEIRNTIFAKMEQQVSDKLTVRGDISYSDRNNSQRNTRGTVTATIFGPGNANVSQINPYYIFPTGSAATSETVRWDADALLGPGAHTNSGAKDFFANGEVEYKLNKNWRVTLAGTHGEDTSRQQIIGSLCSSCALLALNGTTNTSGSLTTVSVPATGLIVTQTPLTAANALDPFLVASNPTSAAVLARLTDSTQTYIAHSTLSDTVLKIDGSLFHLPAGDVKAAAGVEYAAYTLTQDITRRR